MSLPGNNSLGFVGFGEAGFHIARGLIEAGVPEIVAFDIHRDTPGRGETIRSRAAEAGVRMASLPAELASAADLILSVVTADQALIAATQIGPSLTEQHTYADLNSISPVAKRAIAEAVGDRGASFVEVAIMAPVPPYGHRVPMLVGGENASAFIDRLSPFGVRAEAIGGPIGAAAATKMCRSIMVKGIEALITECMLGASFYGADERVLASLSESFPGIDWPKLADYMIGRVVVHGERRAREMEEVADTLRAAGVEPMMTEAVVRRMDWSVETGLRKHFAGEAPGGYREVVEAVRGGGLAGG
jgi:3-hydroxyisobutyrate dehydrogenase-like beta-hydroxyacid dehydrogenase